MTDINTFGCNDCARALSNRLGQGAATEKCPGCAARSIATSPQAAVAFTGGDAGPLIELTRGRAARAGIKTSDAFRAQIKAWYSLIKGRSA